MAKATAAQSCLELERELAAKKAGALRVKASDIGVATYSVEGVVIAAIPVDVYCPITMEELDVL